jgi:hypothetical protein
MIYSRYLEAFYRGYSRHTRKGRDNVQYRYNGNYQVIFWSYNSRVIAIAVSQDYDSARYLLLRQPSGKSKKAILARIDSILLRYSLLRHEAQPTNQNPAWKSGALFLYIPGTRKQTNKNNSIAQRIKQIWND